MVTSASIVAVKLYYTHYILHYAWQLTTNHRQLIPFLVSHITRLDLYLGNNLIVLKPQT